MPKSPVSKPRSASFGPPAAIRFSLSRSHRSPGASSLRRSDYVREGDTFTVTKLDRLARSVGDLLEIVARLEAKKVSLRVLAMSGAEPLDTGTAIGRLMLAVIGAVGQAEREAMLERQREGTPRPRRRAAIRAVCRPFGDRQPKSSGSKRRASGRRKSPAGWGVGRASVYRVLLARPSISTNAIDRSRRWDGP